MNHDLLPLLPDAAFYELALFLPLNELVQLQATYGEERKELFQRLTIQAGRKYALEGLNLAQINEVVTIEDPKTKVAKSIQYGDFATFYCHLSGECQADLSLVKSALKAGRDKISLAMLQDMGNFYGACILIREALPNRCLESARYLLNSKDLATLMEMNGPGDTYQPE